MTHVIKSLKTNREEGSINCAGFCPFNFTSPELCGKKVTIIFTVAGVYRSKMEILDP
jgi:hypothetical protein